MTARIVCVLLLCGSVGRAQGEPFDRFPLSPGAYDVDGKSGGLCRLGPGGGSLVIESADALSIVTRDGAKVHVDQYRPDGVTRLDGGFEGAALVATGAGAKLTLTPADGGAVVMRLQTPKQTSATTWTRAVPVASGAVTGIGGVFMKAQDGKKLREWYRQHLGLAMSPYGFAPIHWRELDDPAHVATTVWATFKPDSTHFDGPFMINYRVDHLDVLMKKLEKDGIKIERSEDEPGNGHFAWVRDGEGHLVELWEPAPGK